ncbi:MAG TPA: flippase activity-associated protein Agl23 [Vicinamibacterales bacterium]
MTRAGAVALVAIALTAGLALRLARLDVRPMHNDEANQAIKFGALLERGEYRYDAFDHHGPTLYYLSLPAAWLRGQNTLASLDERTIRGVTAVAGAATILLLPLVAAGIGRTAVAAAAVLMALSPAMVFYSRMYIQESMFAGFTLAFVIAIGRVATGGGMAWSMLAGIAAGLAVATKETSVIVLPAALVACAIAWWSLGPGRPRTLMAGGQWKRSAVVGLTAAGAVAGLFYSSFFADLGGVLGPLRAAGTYLDRGVDPGTHAHPWHFYLGLLAYSSSGGLTWTEGLVLALAAVGVVTAWAPPRASDASRESRTFWVRYLTCNALIAAAIFSAIPYKTPWNLLPFYVGVIVVAGIGFSTLVQATASRVVRAALTAMLVIASGHLGWQAWRASVTYASDPRNPYVYAQTVPDAVRMATRIRELAAVHPDGARMQVSVMAPPHEQWPLPWYLRTMPHVGYWTGAGDALALQAPVIVASTDHTDALDRALGDRYVSEFFGLRPEVLLTLYIERGLWERFLARVAMGGIAKRHHL